MFGVTGDVYAMVSIYVNLGYRWSDKRRSDQRRSAIKTLCERLPCSYQKLCKYAPNQTCFTLILLKRTILFSF